MYHTIPFLLSAFFFFSLLDLVRRMSRVLLFDSGFYSSWHGFLKRKITSPCDLCSSLVLINVVPDVLYVFCMRMFSCLARKHELY